MTNFEFEIICSTTDEILYCEHKENDFISVRAGKGKESTIVVNDITIDQLKEIIEKMEAIKEVLK